MPVIPATVQPTGLTLSLPIGREIRGIEANNLGLVRDLLDEARITLDKLNRPEGYNLRCQPWRAKRRLVDPSSREAALFSRRALRQRENKVGLRTRRPVIGRQVRSSNELAKLLRSAG